MISSDTLRKGGSMDIIVEITGRGYRGRVLFEIFSMAARGTDSSG
jgi:hypothetical protein